MTEKFVVSEHNTGDEVYKLCSDVSFGRRLRSLSDRQRKSSSWVSPYSIGQVNANPNTASWTFQIASALYPDAVFHLVLDILKDNGSVRLRFDEVNSSTGYRRYSKTADAVLVKEPVPSSLEDIEYTNNEKETIIKLWDGQTLEIQHQPFLLSVKRQDGKEAVQFNERGLFHLEHYRSKETKQPEKAKWFEGEADGTEWEENFREFTDTYTKGPEGFSFDISFPGSQHVFGLAEHAAPLSLPSTDGTSGTDFKQPYRIYNIDYGFYPAHSPVGLYGVVPLIQSHSPGSSVAILTMMGSEGYVDVTHRPEGVQTHWFGESGLVDMFILLGTTPESLFKQYASLTGTTPLPPLFSMGHHQCRWNYDSQEDVLSVTKGFDDAGIPLDVIWLDIEWTGEGHRYFEWDKENFPDPMGMLAKLDEEGRKLVAIVDPHLAASEDYSVMASAEKQGLLVKTPDGKETYVGTCWPGDSGWVDYHHPESGKWWESLFSYEHFKESNHNLHLWNDMNEPAVFSGPEKSLPKECLHHGGVEHRDVHNLYGMLMQKATFEGLAKRDKPAKRPFVLSRSFFAGSQRYGAIWTGDNLGTWDHLAGQTAMLLSCCVSGINFIGADVGGFFGDPEHEMLVRWYQAGAFMPFFRAHANNDTKRREPYLFPPDIQSNIRESIRLRYRFLMVWYTAFRDCGISGMPLMRPQYVEYPDDIRGYGIGTQYYIGNTGLLFSPVVKAGAVEGEVWLAPGDTYFDFYTGTEYPSSPIGRSVQIPAPLTRSPLLLRGGSIIPLLPPAQRSSHKSLTLPITLYIALNSSQQAQGEIYLDDGESFDYSQGAFVWKKFIVEGGVLRCEDKSGGEGKGGSGTVVEKVVVWGTEGRAGEVVLEGLGLKVGDDWKLDLIKGIEV